MIDTTTEPRRFYRYLIESGFKLDIDHAGQLIVTTPTQHQQDLHGWLSAAAG